MVSDGPGRHLHDPGTYAVYTAQNKALISRLTIVVCNDATDRAEAQSFYESLTEADLAELANTYRRVGWSVPLVQKDTINGIPFLIVRDEQSVKGTSVKLRVLEMDLWAGDKSFYIKFAYPHTEEAIAAIKRIITSIQLGANAQLMEATAAAF
jgi:hypothetical protein